MTSTIAAPTTTVERALQHESRLPAEIAVLDAALDAVAQVEVAMRRLTAVRAVLLDAARRQVPVAELALLRPASQAARAPLTNRDADLAHRAFVADLAAALQLPERTASALVEEARTLVHDLPSTLRSLGAGTVSYRHAQVLVEQTADLGPEARAAVEAAVLPRATTTTAASLRRQIRRARERVHPEPTEVRHARAATGRCVRLDPAADGMTWLTAFLPAATGHAVMDRLDHAASALSCADEPRSRDQLRADVLSALLLDGSDAAAARALDQVFGAPGTNARLVSAPDGRARATGPHDGASTGDAGRPSTEPRRTAHLARGIVPRVSVTVPVLTLLGGDEPAELNGYGPIDPETARELASSAPSFTRILTDPHTDTVLAVGRTSYAVPADLRRHLAVRDGTCRFPGCGRRATACDVDHVTAFVDGGATDARNLVHLCRHHHRLKHETSWRASLVGSAGPDGTKADSSSNPPGTVRWTSPTGRVHTTAPAHHIGSPIRERSTQGAAPPTTGPPPF